MRVALIAEGPADLAVLVNILKGKLEIEFEDIQFLRPEYALDETDLHHQPEGRFSNWEFVKRECLEGVKISEFLESPIEEDRLVVIHIDTAEVERDGYQVVRPARQGNAGYAAALRALVVAKINEWLGGRFGDSVRHAVAVEEMDAWVLTIFSTKETASQVNVKERLVKAIHKPNAFSDKERKKLFQLTPYEQYEKLSQLFRKPRELAECAKRNESLRLFVDSLP
jgi:hypothetical protein